jgi:hypothetical protein
VITLALSQELIGEPREDHFFRLHQASLRPFFPGLNERSRYHRRKHDLWSVMLAVRVSLQVVLDALEVEETAAIDSAPVPCVSYTRGKGASEFVGTADYGVCSSKAMKYFGCTLHHLLLETERLEQCPDCRMYRPSSRYCCPCLTRGSGEEA